MRNSYFLKGVNTLPLTIKNIIQNPSLSNLRKLMYINFSVLSFVFPLFLRRFHFEVHIDGFVSNCHFAGNYSFCFPTPVV